MTLRRLSSWSIALLLGAFAPLVHAQQATGDWRQSVFLYGMGARIEGDAQVGPLQVPVVAESGSVSCKASEDRS